MSETILRPVKKIGDALTNISFLAPPEKDCDECRQPFLAPSGERGRYVTTCPHCIEARKIVESERYQERIKDQRDAEWSTICPPAYRGTERAKLPNLAALDEVLRWNYSETGITLHGPTRRGKTRCAWLLLAREYERGKSVACMDSTAGLKYAALWSEKEEAGKKVERWIEGMIRVDILLMDDVFKNKLTDSFEGVIFTLIDQRMQNMKPIILTSNDTAATLSGRMTEDRKDPLLARLRESTKQIHF
jgi:DNA replication protein DnaC